MSYFQAFSNTYTSPSHLDQMIHEAMSHPQIAAVILGTRPDCLPESTHAVGTVVPVPQNAHRHVTPRFR